MFFFVKFCDVYLFFFSDCLHHQFSIKTMPTPNQSRRSWLASDSSDAFLCLSQRIHEQFADVFGAYSGFYAGIKCLISYQGATMDWAASADQNGTSRANQCLAEKLRINGCKSTILFERLHSNVKIGWPSKPRNFRTGLNSLYLRIVIPTGESLYSVHKPILGLRPPTNATRTGFPLWLPSMPSIELLGPGNGGTDPGVANKRAMYLGSSRRKLGEFWFPENAAAARTKPTMVLLRALIPAFTQQLLQHLRHELYLQSIILYVSYCISNNIHVCKTSAISEHLASQQSEFSNHRVAYLFSNRVTMHWAHQAIVPAQIRTRWQQTKNQKKIKWSRVKVNIQIIWHQQKHNNVNTDRILVSFFADLAMSSSIPDASGLLLTHFPSVRCHRLVRSIWHGRYHLEEISSHMAGLEMGFITWHCLLETFPFLCFFFCVSSFAPLNPPWHFQQKIG